MPVANDESGVMVGDPSDPNPGQYLCIRRDMTSTPKQRRYGRRGGATDPKADVRMYPERPGIGRLHEQGIHPRVGRNSRFRFCDSGRHQRRFCDCSVRQSNGRRNEQEFSEAFCILAENIFDPGDEVHSCGAMRMEQFCQTLRREKALDSSKANFIPTRMIPYDLKLLVIVAIGGPAETAKQRVGQLLQPVRRVRSSG